MADLETEKDGLPKTEREARRWIRQHWGYLIRHADMGAVADLGSDVIEKVWGDECAKIACPLTPPR